jgi:hypothetical protein
MIYTFTWAKSFVWSFTNVIDLFIFKSLNKCKNIIYTTSKVSVNNLHSPNFRWRVYVYLHLPSLQYFEPSID